MTQYVEKFGLTLLTGSVGAGLLTRSIDTVPIAVWPHTVTLPVGEASILEDGTVVFDDLDDATGNPVDGDSAANGSFNFTLWDNVTETAEYTCTMQLNGVQLPPIAGGALADQAYSVSTGIQVYDTSFDFTGGPVAAYSLVVTPAGVSIDASTGIISVDTANPIPSTAIVVVATNSGGSVSSGFQLIVTGVTLDSFDGSHDTSYDTV